MFIGVPAVDLGVVREPLKRAPGETSMSRESLGDPARESREHVLEGHDLAERREPDLLERPVEDRLDHDASQVRVRQSFELRQPGFQSGAHGEITEERRMRCPVLFLDAQLLQHVVQEVLSGLGRRQRIEKGEELRGPQVSADDVLDEAIVLTA